MARPFKKCISILLAAILMTSILQGCAGKATQELETEAETGIETQQEAESVSAEIMSDEEIAQSFKGLNDPDLQQYIEDSIYSDLTVRMESDDYQIENITTSYLSKEYIEELEYNSRQNSFFGYTLSELDQQFSGTRYVFTLGDDGKTTVKEFVPYDDTMEKVIKNVAIGTGVILVCVVIAVVTHGAGATVPCAIFAAAAKSGATAALSSGVISAASAGIMTGLETGDFEQIKKEAALAGSKSFKWGAVFGAVTGGLGKALEAGKAIHSAKESEQMAEKIYKGRTQISFLNGKEVPQTTPGATRPDIVRDLKGSLEAVEVKNYNLKSEKNIANLISELKRQVQDRIVNLPEGSTQRIVLDATGRQYTKEFVKEIIMQIKNALSGIYHDIPIDVIGAL